MKVKKKEMSALYRDFLSEYMASETYFFQKKYPVLPLIGKFWPNLEWINQASHLILNIKNFFFRSCHTYLYYVVSYIQIQSKKIEKSVPWD